MTAFRKILLPGLALLLLSTASAQPPRLSLASNGVLLRSFKPDQQYWSFGQTVQFIFHTSPTDGPYAWIAYFSDGKFINRLQAQAMQSSTTPQTVNFDNSAHLRFKHISLGWRKYLKGRYDADKSWNLCAMAGFGLLLGRIENTQSTHIDPLLYSVPVQAGKANFKRLTLDLGLSPEFPVGADVCLYLDGRIHIPTTDYPSPYLFVNRKAPLTAGLGLGVRILIN